MTTFRPQRRTKNENSLLLCCGAAASLCYVSADVLAGFLAGRTSSPLQYSFAYNSISELLIPSAPPVSRAVGVGLMVVSAILQLLFASAILRRYEKNRALRRVGLCIGIAAMTNLMTATVFPQDVRGTNLSFSGAMHLILVACAALLSLAAMYSFAVSVPSQRIYTAVSVAIMCLGGAITPGMEPRNLLGVAERISVYSLEAWQFVASIVLWRGI